MATTWTIAVDWDRDGSFASANDDITSRLISAQWFLGNRQPYQDTADNSVLTLTLNNSDKFFSPDYASSPIYGKKKLYRPIRIQSNDGTTTRTHWIGWVESLLPQVNRYGQRTAQLVATGPIQFLKAGETNLGLQQNKRADEIVKALMLEVIIPPALSFAWVLGRVGNSELGASTYLPNIAAATAFEAGITTFNEIGDTWVQQGGASDTSKNTFDVFHAISDITAAERGRFFFDRDGKAIFWNRHHFFLNADTPVVFDDAMTGMDYSYSGIEDVKNEIIITYHPRVVSSGTTDILWQLGDAIIPVSAGQSRTIYVKYEDYNNTGKRLGARDVTATNLVSVKGTTSVSVVAQASGAELTFRNTGTQNDEVTQCTLQGRKIIDYGQIETKAVDTSSMVDYGKRTLRMNLPSLETLEQAQGIATYELARRGTPKGMVSSITVASHGKNGGTQHSNQLALTLGKPITVRETQTGHQHDYFIVGERHDLNEGATLWVTTWFLEPASDIAPWKLGAVGRGELGTNTRVTY